MDVTVYTDTSLSTIVDYQYTAAPPGSMFIINETDPITNSSFSVGNTTVNVNYTVDLSASSDQMCTFIVTVRAPPCLDQPIFYVEPSQSIIVDYQYRPAHPIYNVTILGTDPITNTSFSVGATTVNVDYQAPVTNGDDNLTCTFDVTVREFTDPICPISVSAESGPGNPTAMAYWSAATAVYSAEFPILYSHPNGSSFPIGDTTVTAYATDHPNINCTFTVSVVEDSSPPVFSTELDDVLTFGNSERPSWRLTATDNSNVVTITSSPSPGSYFPLGNTSVTVTATDNANNPTTQTFIVQVVSDGSPETRNCPPDQEINVAPSQVPITVSWTVPTATGSGTIMTTPNYNPGDMFNEGTTKVTYKFTDDTGRSSTCFFKIRITLNADQTPPNVDSCPADFAVNRPAGTVETMVTWTEPVFIDDVSGTDLTIQQTKVSGSNFTAGTTEVLYTARDGNFNTASCTFTVTVNVVQDNDPPVIVGCPANFTHWVRVGTRVATVSWVAPNITDASPVTVEGPDPPSQVFTVGNDTAVAYVATDVVNNVATCTFFVSVREDGVDPVLQCPANINMLVREGTVTMVEVTWPTPVATDNSGDVTVTSSPASGTSFQVSTTGQINVVTVTATDAAGNAAMCTFNVAIGYDVAPMLTCPDVMQPTDTGQATASATWPDVVITDDFTSVSALRNTSTHGSMISNLRYDADPITVTLTAEDERGNIGTCTFTVDVVDQESPVWVCPGNITEMAEVGTNSKVVSWTLPTVSDNSGKAPIRSNNPPTSQTFSGGVWPVVYTATDDSGNVGTCTFYVTIEVDSDVPTFDNCPTSPVSVNSDPDTNSAVVDWGVITAMDNGGGATTVTSNYANNQRLDIGSYNVVYEARDESGNVAYCRFTAVVVDGEAPGFISCVGPPPVYILNSQPSVAVTWTEPTFVDNSIDGFVTATLAQGSTGPGTRRTEGTHVIEYIARDAAGNTASTCTFNITVLTTTDTIVLEGEVELDVVRGINGRFVFSDDRQIDLRNDLDDYFRITSSLGPNFVGIEILSRPFNDANNVEVQFALHFRNPSYYNEEEIRDAFYSALDGLDGTNFAITNAIVPRSFNLHVREFRGQFTLQRIQTNPTSDTAFTSCCSNPSSALYLALEERIHLYLRLTFFNALNNFKMVKSLRLRPGSIIVPYTITLGEDSTATTLQADSAFLASVDATSLQWIPGGQQSELFLVSRVAPNVLLFEEVCPASFVCMNSGTCTVNNATYIYDHLCSCPSGTSGDNCENAGIVLSQAAIIGIVCGVLLFLLLLLFICCCCYLFLAAPRGRYKDAEYGRKAAPLMLMPRDDYIYRRPPIMDRPGPIITEVEEAHDAPVFMHESDDYRAPIPTPLAIEPVQRYKSPRPNTLGPRFEHEYEDYLPPPRRGHRSRANRFRDMLPDRIPRARRRDDFGPRFQGDSRPERVEDMKRRLYREFNY